MWYQTTVGFAATPETVYNTLWKAPAREHSQVETNVLERLTVTGTPEHVGHVQQLRTAYGSLDLFVMETVRIAERPFCYEVQQIPDGLQRHDPAERDIPFLNSMVEDLDQKFQIDFGDQPLATIIRIDLAATESRTNATVTLSVPDANKLGAFQLWRWKRYAKQQVKIIQKQTEALL